MPAYEVTRRPGDGLAVIVSRWGEQIWSRGLTGVRKPATCCRCGRAIARGERAYRPITNGANRSDRLCLACGDPPPNED